MLTPDEARKKFNDLMEEIIDTLSTTGLLCMPNETGFEIEGAGIEDNEKINIHRSFTAFWLLKMARRQGTATKDDIDDRIKLCLSIIGMHGSEKTDKMAQTLFG